MKRKKRERLFFYSFISPWIIGFLLFSVIPMVTSIYYSFTKITVLGLGRKDPVWVGFKNYVDLFADSDFIGSIGTTFAYSFLRVFIGVFLSLMVALLVNKDIYFKKLFRTLIYLPAIIPVVGSAIIWSQLFSSDFSLLNYLLSIIGIPPINWLSYDNSFWSVLFMSLWCGIGPTMIIIVSALQNVPKELLEAAEIDGAGPVRRFGMIVVPLISSTLLYNLVTGFISTLQAYAEMDLLTGGFGNTETMAMNVVNNAFSDDGGGLGYACAQAWIIFIIILIFTLLFFKITTKNI